MKILAVDDDPIFLELLSGMLRDLRHDDVTTANSGQQAMRILEQSARPFDCLFFDIQMPGMSGVELCGAIRGTKTYRSTPIVMITAMSGRAFVDDAFSAGATDYVIKPLDRLDLKARAGMVERLLNERQHMAALENLAGVPGQRGQRALDFDTPLLIPGIERGTEYLAMENYLLTIGMTRKFGLSAFGINIGNAPMIFARAAPAAFVDMLGDVAAAIFGEMKTDQVLLAYAGGGNFVGLARRGLSAEPGDLEIMINSTLAGYEDIYTADGLPVPTITFGPLAKCSVFDMNKPTRILEKAIALAQPARVQKSALRRMAA